MRANGFTRTNYTFTGWNTKANGSGTAYAAGASYKAAANLTLYAQWKASGYTLKWTGALSSKSTYLGEGDVSAKLNASYCGCKRIEYTDTSGKTAYANPYQAGSITIKQGTAVTLQMINGRGGPSNKGTTLGWKTPEFTNSVVIDIHLIRLNSHPWTPSGSYTLSKVTDIEGDSGGYYEWIVAAN